MVARVLKEVDVRGKTLRLVLGDITERDVDAIVNAANSHLQHGGGVAAAILRRGGRVIQDESDRIGFTPVGTAVITSGGALRARWVIHAVGTRMGEGDEDAKLRGAVRSVLELAEARGLRSVSMPAISSGIFGFPKDRCARILVGEAARFLRERPSGALRELEFCLFDDRTAGYFLAELDRALP
jgi:O-acetyl-ADP-ribose deacetylase (regulator of RNase III)